MRKEKKKTWRFAKIPTADIHLLMWEPCSKTNGWKKCPEEKMKWKRNTFFSTFLRTVPCWIDCRRSVFSIVNFYFSFILFYLCEVSYLFFLFSTLFSVCVYCDFTVQKNWYCENEEKPCDELRIIELMRKKRVSKSKSKIYHTEKENWKKEKRGHVRVGKRGRLQWKKIFVWSMPGKRRSMFGIIWKGNNRRGCRRNRCGIRDGWSGNRRRWRDTEIGGKNGIWRGNRSKRKRELRSVRRFGGVRRMRVTRTDREGSGSKSDSRSYISISWLGLFGLRGEGGVGIGRLIRIIGRIYFGVVLVIRLEGLFIALWGIWTDSSKFMECVSSDQKTTEMPSKQNKNNTMILQNTFKTKERIRRKTIR